MAIETSDRRESAQSESGKRETGTGESDIDRDELFHLLQNERRRRALDYLRRQDGPIRMREVVDHVAAAEHDTSPEALRSDERKRVHIALYQSHLPKLDQVGVIDYDQDRGTITRTPLANQLDPYLEAATGERTAEITEETAETSVDDASPASGSKTEHSGAPETETVGWHRYYLALSGLSLLVLLGGVALGATVITPLTMAVVVIAAFTALACTQWAHVRGWTFRESSTSE